MSGKFYKLDATIAARRDLTGNDKLVVVIISNYIGANEKAWPGLRRIATDAGVSVGTVRESLERLEKAGMLLVEKRGQGKCQHYRISETVQKTYTVGVQETCTVKKNKLCRKPTQSVQKTYTELCRKPTQKRTRTIKEPKGARKKQKPVSAKIPKHRQRVGPDTTDETFAVFWETYPLKVAKAKAQASWKKIKPSGDLLGTILAALESHKDSEQWQKDGGRYIPHPATWLNGRRWEDELGTDGGNGDSEYTRAWLKLNPPRNPTEEDLRICGTI